MAIFWLQGAISNSLRDPIRPRMVSSVRRCRHRFRWAVRPRFRVVMILLSRPRPVSSAFGEDIAPNSLAIPVSEDTTIFTLN